MYSVLWPLGKKDDAFQWPLGVILFSTCLLRIFLGTKSGVVSSWTVGLERVRSGFKSSLIHEPQWVTLGQALALSLYKVLYKVIVRIKQKVQHISDNFKYMVDKENVPRFNPWHLPLKVLGWKMV